jgi:predicted phosphoadenosine phosphosulfate sulfurtransferase
LIALSPFKAKVYNTSMKRMAMILANLVAIAATVTGGQEKSVGLTLGPAMEIGREESLFASIASVCEDNELNFYVLDRSTRSSSSPRRDACL